MCPIQREGKRLQPPCSTLATSIRLVGFYSEARFWQLCRQHHPQHSWSTPARQHQQLVRVGLPLIPATACRILPLTCQTCTSCLTPTECPCLSTEQTLQPPLTHFPREYHTPRSSAAPLSPALYDATTLYYVFLPLLPPPPPPGMLRHRLTHSPSPRSAHVHAAAPLP